ncbi:MAG: hypothetical protein HON90_17295 [Halobacteriovoraceae bacterium]|jgi:hypothetical protein|nr:hypothetical protein [Halobacteriovoraceae bacterium]
MNTGKQNQSFKLLVVLLVWNSAWATEPSDPKYIQASVQTDKIQTPELRAIKVDGGHRYSFDFQSNFTKQLTVAPDQEIRGFRLPIDKENYNTCDIGLSGSGRRVFVGGRGDITKNGKWTAFGHDFWFSMKKLEDLILDNDACLKKENCEFSVNIGNIAHENYWYRGRSVQLTGYVKDLEVYMTELSYSLAGETLDCAIGKAEAEIIVN